MVELLVFANWPDSVLRESNSVLAVGYLRVISQSDVFFSQSATSQSDVSKGVF